MGSNELCHAENCRRGRQQIHSPTPHRYAHTAVTKSDTHTVFIKLHRQLFSPSHGLPSPLLRATRFPLRSVSLTHKHTIAAVTKPPAGLAGLCWQNTNYKSFSADVSLPARQCIEDKSECMYACVCSCITCESVILNYMCGMMNHIVRTFLFISPRPAEAQQRRTLDKKMSAERRVVS